MTEAVRNRLVVNSESAVKQRRPLDCKMFRNGVEVTVKALRTGGFRTEEVLGGQKWTNMWDIDQANSFLDIVAGADYLTPEEESTRQLLQAEESKKQKIQKRASTGPRQ